MHYHMFLLTFVLSSLSSCSHSLPVQLTFPLTLSLLTQTVEEDEHPPRLGYVWIKLHSAFCSMWSCSHLCQDHLIDFVSLYAILRDTSLSEFSWSVLP